MIPVAGMFALALATVSPARATTVGVGAMLTGMSWRGNLARRVPPVGTLFASALMLALVTFLGTLTLGVTWLHLVLLFLICLIAGVTMVIGRHGVMVGYRAVIGYVVFGVLPAAGATGALSQAGLVLAGGLGQALFATFASVPMSWQRERLAVGSAFRQLAAMTEDPAQTAVDTARALDAAAATLRTPALFADPSRTRLLDLVDEGRRLRLELLVLQSTALHELDGMPDRERLEQQLLEVQTRLRVALARIAEATSGDAAAVASLQAEVADFATWRPTRKPIRKHRIEARVAAAIGQAGAATRLAAQVSLPGERGLSLPLGRGRSVVFGRPSFGSRNLRRAVLSDLRRVRENATLHSMAGRHALRMAVAVVATAVLVEQAGILPRSYWAVLTVALVLKPNFSATYTRVFERTLGTAVGVVSATLIASLLSPHGWEIVVIVAIAAFITYLLFSAHFLTGIASLTALVVFLMHGVNPDSAQTALDRGIDTAIGGLVGALAYTVWPSWSGASLHLLLDRLVQAQRAYFDAISAALTNGRLLPEADARRLARDSRVATTDAEAAIELAENEPARGELDHQSAANALAGMRRVIWAVHGLRLEVVGIAAPQPFYELAPLREATLEAFTAVSTRLRDLDAEPGELPPLRQLYNETRWPDERGFPRPIRAQLDELIDALDATAAALEIALP
jgi:uncharacterized membrane protein YccC